MKREVPDVHVPATCETVLEIAAQRFVGFEGVNSRRGKSVEQQLREVAVAGTAVDAYGRRNVRAAEQRDELRRIRRVVVAHLR